jgi:gamma-glutamyl:cysteine ligase YbdK (ATP-grasp superfamily)
VDGAKFGIEAEYALVRPDGRFADHSNTQYAEVKPVIDALPDFRHAGLRVGDAGIRVKNWYVEGDERFDEQGRSTAMIFKGIEIRTPPLGGIGEAMASLKALRAMLAAELEGRRWKLAAIGFNPVTATYAPAYAPWERAVHASRFEHSLPQVSTLSFGPDFNFSLRGDTPEGVMEKVRRLTWYSPFIVPFSFASPFAAGALWRGLSYRTWRRTGPRPAALAHLRGAGGRPLAKEADPPSHHLRIEFKAFDMVADDRLLAELFRLVLGIALAEPEALPGRADLPDAALHRKAAVRGLDDGQVRREAARALDAAREALDAAGEASALPLIEEMLETRRTPAHAMREEFLRTGALYRPLEGGTQ